VPVTHG
jgi:chromosome segregation ATPase